jgi:hypothetical protein
MMDIQLYSQIIVFLLFAIYSGIKKGLESSYPSPKSMIEIFNFIKFAYTSLDDVEKEKLHLNSIISEEYINSLPKEYKYLIEKFKLFNANKIFTYDELLQDLKSKKEKEVEKSFFEKIIGDRIVEVVFIVIVTLLVTLGSFISLITFDGIKETNKKVSWNILVHPSIRSQTLIFNLGVVSAVIAIYLICTLVFNTIPNIKNLLLILSIPIFLNIISFFILIQNHKKFKNKWSEIFDYIMQKATINNNNNMYNRAYNCSCIVKNYPSIPLTGEAKVYLTLTTIAQFLIAYVPKFIS